MHFSCRKNKNADRVEQQNLKARFERKRQNVKKRFTSMTRQMQTLCAKALAINFHYTWPPNCRFHFARIQTVRPFAVFFHYSSQTCW